MLEVLSALPDTRWLVVDGASVNTIDATGASTLEELVADLRDRSVRLGFARLRTEVRSGLERAGVVAALGVEAFFPTIKSALRAIEGVAPDESPDDSPGAPEDS